MNDRRFKFGVAASAVWLIGAAALLLLKRADLASMQPNAWGDFFAGCFALLAFLWLVLGYLQQGEELRLSSDALRLQAEELQHSVEQQRQLVEVTRQQVEHERGVLEEERQQRILEMRPSMQVSNRGGNIHHGDGTAAYGIEFSNAGNVACSFYAVIRLPTGSSTDLQGLAAFNRGQTCQATIGVQRAVHIDGQSSSFTTRTK